MPKVLDFTGAPGATRTHGTQIRNLIFGISRLFPKYPFVLDISKAYL